jgi:hypothetical protein
MNVDITGASFEVGSCSSTCPWTVTSDVTIVNITNQELDYQSVSVTVFWQDSNDGTTGVTTGVAVLNPGSPPLQAGDTLGTGDQAEYDGFSIQFSLPSGATDADLAVSITSQDGTGSGDAPFLQGGDPLPIGVAGGLGAVVFVAGLFGYSRWRAATRKAKLRRLAVVRADGRTHQGVAEAGARTADP